MNNALYKLYIMSFLYNLIFKTLKNQIGNQNLSQKKYINIKD